MSTSDAFEHGAAGPQRPLTKARQDGGAAELSYHDYPPDLLQELLAAQKELRRQRSELAAARDALDSERQRYQDLFDSGPLGYFQTDLNSVIGQANPLACSLLKMDAASLIG